MGSDVQVGKGILFGINPKTGQKIEIDGVAGILDSAKVMHKFEVDSIKDESNFTAAQIATDPHLELDLVWTPSGESRQAAADGVVFLLPLGKVELKNFKIDSLNGKWSYQGDMALELNKKQAKLQFKIKKWDDPDQNDALTTVIEG